MRRLFALLLVLCLFPAAVFAGEVQETDQNTVYPEDAEFFNEFSGAWVNETAGYLTIWGKDITAAFLIDGELVTGYYGNPGEWSREGDELRNSNGMVIRKQGEDSIYCVEESGEYVFYRVFYPCDIRLNPDTSIFTGGWTGIGILITDPSGVRIFTPVSGYKLKIEDDRIQTMFEGKTNEYPFEVIPDNGTLVWTPSEEEQYALVLYEDGSLRWQVMDDIILVFVYGLAETAEDTQPEETTAPDGEEETETPESPEEPVPAETSETAEPETPEVQEEPASAETPEAAEPETPEAQEEPPAEETSVEDNNASAIPQGEIRQVNAQTEGIVLYVDSDDSVTLQYVPEAGGTPEKAEWILRPDYLAQILPGEGETVTLQPVRTGKGKISIHPLTGKVAQIRISVLQPVESIELRQNGRALPGGILFINTILRPKNAGDRTITWSLDVGEDVATINKHGKIRISPDTPAGTVITVTCTAFGAKTPVVQTIEVTVEAKK